MNRLEFLTSLRYSLEKGGLPQADIEDALSYYEEIFLDAGYGSDEQTAKSLGAPEELAREILIENGIHVDGDAVFEVGGVNKKKPFEDFQDVEFEEVGKEGNAQGGPNGYGYGYGGAGGFGGNGGQNGQNGRDWGATFSNAANKFGQAMDSAFNTAKQTYDRSFNDPTMTAEQKRSRNNTILKIIIIVVSAPLWIGLVGGAFGVLVSLLAGLVAVIFALLAAGVSLVFGGIAELFSVTPVGVIMIGAGMIILGIFGLAARPALRGLTKLFKAAARGCRKLWRRIFG